MTRNSEEGMVQVLIGGKASSRVLRRRCQLTGLIGAWFAAGGGDSARETAATAKRRPDRLSWRGSGMVGFGPDAVSVRPVSHAGDEPLRERSPVS